MSGEREQELRDSLAALRERIARACDTAGRDPASLTLIAITKTRPASDVALLAALGVRDVGENRDQEARAKLAELTELAEAEAGADGEVADGAAAETTALRWHLVGQLQTNKARSAARWASAVHSVDRSRLVGALATASRERRAPLDVFVQVDLDESADAGRGGARPADVEALAAEITAHDSLRLRGVMAVAPREGDPDAAFARLADVSTALAARHPQADAISAGMSGDLEAAVRHGATHLRVGSALLGRRAPVVG